MIETATDSFDGDSCRTDFLNDVGGELGRACVWVFHVVVMGLYVGEKKVMFSQGFSSYSMLERKRKEKTYGKSIKIINQTHILCCIHFNRISISFPMRTKHHHSFRLNLLSDFSADFL